MPYINFAQEEKHAIGYWDLLYEFKNKIGYYEPVYIAMEMYKHSYHSVDFTLN